MRAVACSAPRRTWRTSSPPGLDPTSALSASAPTSHPTTSSPGTTRSPTRRCCRRASAGPPGPTSSSSSTGRSAATSTGRRRRTPTAAARRRGGRSRPRSGSRGPARPSAARPGHYYCVTAPDFLIEYDNTQDDANHAHSVWRHLRDDFGADPLRAHYARHHPGRLAGRDRRDGYRTGTTPGRAVDTDRSKAHGPARCPAIRNRPRSCDEPERVRPSRTETRAFSPSPTVTSVPLPSADTRTTSRGSPR